MNNETKFLPSCLCSVGDKQTKLASESLKPTAIIGEELSETWISSLLRIAFGDSSNVGDDGKDGLENPIASSAEDPSLLYGDDNIVTDLP